MPERWLLPAFEQMTIDELRRFANGCLAIAKVPERLSGVDCVEVARANLGVCPNHHARADMAYVLSILDKPDLARMYAQNRKAFLRG